MDPNLVEIGLRIIKGDVKGVRELLTAHPEHLHAYRANDSWLHRAALYDNLEMVKAIVECGLDVNTPEKNNPEGAIDRAATKGHLDVVRWFLDNGAKVNFEVNGEVRSTPLAGASFKGNLEMVKLLVEHGADFNAVWGEPPMNALAYAMLYNHTEVEDYLRSKGARLPDEVEIHDEATAPIEDEEGKGFVWQHIRNHWGRPASLSLQEIVLGDPSIKIHVVPGEALFRNYSVLATEGMSSKAMKVPRGQKDYQYAELVIYLPNDWPVLDEKRMAQPKYSWPVEWLRKIARWPHEHKTWLGGECVIIANGEPPEPLGPGVPFTCVMVHAETEPARTLILPDGKRVIFYFLTPLYTEERDLEKEKGLEELLRRFHEVRDDATVDVNRPNVALATAKPKRSGAKKRKK